MDPLTAISLAGNIIAFIDFTAKLLEKTKEIHSSASGFTASDRTVKQVTGDLQRLSLSLKASQASDAAPGTATEALIDLCSNCEDLAGELLSVLNDVQAKDPSSKRQSIKAVAKRMWKSKDIEELQSRLDLLGQALDRNVQEAFRNEVKEKLSEIVRLGNTQHTNITELRKRIDSIRHGIEIASFGSEALQQLKGVIRLSDEVVLKARQTIILEALKFNDMTERFEHVEMAFKDTFGWILDVPPIKPDDHMPTAKSIASESLHRWLKEDSGIIHVLGKPGSGKSTLMRFLCEHPRVERELRIWAGERPLVLANFFFWHPGSKLQRTLEGLIRSLLHSVLEKLPSLIPTTFPAEWALTDSMNLGTGSLPLEKTRLFEAFQILIASPDVLKSYKFAFFIDGLDEFEPDGHRATYLDLVRLLKTWCLNQVESIKICVSSREYPVFETEFAEFPQLRLHHLTVDDMRIVARDFLRSYHIIQLGLDVYSLMEIEWELVSKSDGVFLWLTLVIRNLEDGLINGDNFKDLSSRIFSLPTELSDLYVNLLESIPGHDQSYCFSILRVMYEVHEGFSPSLLLFWCLDMTIRGEGVEDLLQAVYGPRWDEKPAKTAKDYLLQEADKLCKRIRGRFRGLVQSPTPELSALHERVDFNHRSIPEFLASDRGKQCLNLQFSSHDWYRSICHAFELRFRILTHPRFEFLLCSFAELDMDADAFRWFLFWSDLVTSLAIFTSSRFDLLPRRLFDTIDNCVVILSRKPAVFSGWDPKSCPDATYCLALMGFDRDQVTLRCTCQTTFHLSMDLCLARASIYEYFKEKFRWNNMTLRSTGSELLLASLLEARENSWLDLNRCVTMFQTFLEGYIDPNTSIRVWASDPIDSVTLLSLFCLVVKLSYLSFYQIDSRLLLEIISCFIKAGVDTRVWFFATGIDEQSSEENLIRETRQDEGRIIWVSQRVGYISDVLDDVFIKIGLEQPHTLLDVFDKRDLEGFPEVYNSLRASREAILRDFARYGVPQNCPPHIPGHWGSRQCLMVYPQ